MLLRLLSKPKDLSFGELTTILKQHGYILNNKGRTSGSRVLFEKRNSIGIGLHKPHKRKYLLGYQIDDVIYCLKKEGII